MKAQTLGLGQFGGDLVLRALVLGQRGDDLRPTLQVPVDVAQGLQRSGGRGVIRPAAVVGSNLGQWRQVAGSLQLPHQQLGAHVQRCGQQQVAQGEGLAHARHGADEDVVVRQRQVDASAALVGAERDGFEQREGSAVEQRSGVGLALGERLMSDPEHHAAGVLVRYRLGPHAAQRTAQPGGEAFAAVKDVGHRHPVRQVDVRAPSGTVLPDRVWEGDALPALAERLVDLSDAQRAQSALDHRGGQPLHMGGHNRLRDDRLVGGHPYAAENQNQGGAREGQQPRGRQDVAGECSREADQQREGQDGAAPPHARADHAGGRASDTPRCPRWLRLPAAAAPPRRRTPTAACPRRPWPRPNGERTARFAA